MTEMFIDGVTVTLPPAKKAGRFEGRIPLPYYSPTILPDPNVHDNCRAYYRRRMKNGNVRVWLKNGRRRFRLEVSSGVAAKICPGEVVTLSFGLPECGMASHGAP